MTTPATLLLCFVIGRKWGVRPRFPPDNDYRAEFFCPFKIKSEAIIRRLTKASVRPSASGMGTGIGCRSCGVLGGLGFGLKLGVGVCGSLQSLHTGVIRSIGIAAAGV